MRIVGTAGHVDHGKSSLVLALTGTNPDRWAEERLRGMTLDLGFAHLVLRDAIEAAIVDVPGHERFLHNMLAGAAGMEVLLLVVALDDGVMAQTLEHLAILRYLNVHQTILVMTKSDLVEPSERDARIEAIRQALHGTIAADAPCVVVSTRTGDGLDELRETVARALAALPPRRLDAPAYLPVDRVFTLAGHGTVVTGTLMQGALSEGDRVVLHRTGRAVRVRALQSFGRRMTHVEAGSRVGANVPSFDAHDLWRGDVLGGPELRVASELAVEFAAVPQALAILRRQTAVRAYIGAAEILGRLVLNAVPSDESPVRGSLLLDAPTVAIPASPFVVRRLSPKTLLGGGTIVAPGAFGSVPGGDAPNALAPEDAAILRVLSDAGLRPLTVAEAAAAANVREEAAAAALRRLVETGQAMAVPKPAAFMHAEAGSELLGRVLELLGDAHDREPWAMGMTSLALARALNLSEPLTVRFLAAFVEDGRIAARGGYYATPDFIARPTAEQQAFLDSLVSADPASPLRAASFDETVRAVKAARIAGLSKAFDTLLAKGLLIKVGDDLYRGAQIRTIHARLEAFLREHDSMTMAQFRDLIGTSRKYAVPLLEWFDARGITLRSGDVRTLRKAGSRDAATQEDSPAVLKSDV